MDNVKRAQDYSRIPAYLQEARRWVLFRFVFNQTKNKLLKIPFYADGTARSGALNSLEDVERLVTFEQAKAALREHKFDGLGFALGEDGNGCWQGLDLDNIKDNPEFENLLQSGVPGYVERSPSGNGVHAIGYGRGFQAISKGGFEAYSTARFFTVTGNIISSSDKPQDLYDYLDEVAPRLRGVELRPFEKAYYGYTYSGAAALISDDQKKDLRAALSYLDADDYLEWVNVGMALKTCDAGFDLWMEWSARSDKFNKADAIRKWESDLHPERTSYQAVFAKAEQNGWVNPRRSGASAGNITFDFQPQLLSEYNYNIDEATPTEFIIDGFIAAGIFLIAGYPGVGKTSFIVSLATQIAHLNKEVTPFRPIIRRKIVYVTEDPEQVARILRGIKLYGDLDYDSDSVRDWFRIIPARRVAPRALGETLKHVKRHITEHVYEDKTFSAKPLVILDTTNATIDLESENDNAEVGKAVAAIREGLAGIPCWLVTHTSKAVKRGEFDDLTARGASAWEGDTQGNAFLFKDEDAPDNERFMRLGKRRFVARYQELKAVSVVHSEDVDTPWGPPQNISYMINLISSSSLEEREENKERKKEDKANAIRMAKNLSAARVFKEYLESAWACGEVVAVRDGKGGRLVVPKEYGAYRELHWERDVFDRLDRVKDNSVQRDIKDYLKEKFEARYTDEGAIIFAPPSYGISGLGESK